MSLDERPPIVQHRAERAASHHVPTSRRDEWVDDETAWERYVEMEFAEEAAEAMYQEGLANLRRERPFMFAPSDDTDLPGYDRRCFGKGELDNPQPDPEPIRWTA